MRKEEVTRLRKFLDEELVKYSRKFDNVSRSIQQKGKGIERERKR